MVGNLSLLNGFTGAVKYYKNGNIVIVSFAVMCPGNQSAFAIVPDFLKPKDEHYNNIWIQYNATDAGQLIGNITIYTTGQLSVRN